MATNWTEMLPDGVKRPIVIEIKHPMKWRRNPALDPSEMGNRVRFLDAYTPGDRRAREQAMGLAKDRDYNNERGAIAKEFGADHVTVLSIPMAETTDNNAYITVWLPSTYTGDKSRGAQRVMEWFEGSKLGKIYFERGRANQMGQVSATGQTYDALADIANLKPDHNDAYDHTKGHCACH